MQFFVLRKQEVTIPIPKNYVIFPLSSKSTIRNNFSSHSLLINFNLTKTWTMQKKVIENYRRRERIIGFGFNSNFNFNLRFSQIRFSVFPLNRISMPLKLLENLAIFDLHSLISVSWGKRKEDVPIGAGEDPQTNLILNSFFEFRLRRCCHGRIGDSGRRASQPRRQALREAQECSTWGCFLFKRILTSVFFFFFCCFQFGEFWVHWWF